MGTPENLVRYDSPTWAGFSMSADWGQDTYWDVYGRYSGEYNGIKIAAVTGWSETNRCKGNAPTYGSLPQLTSLNCRPRESASTSPVLGKFRHLTPEPNPGPVTWATGSPASTSSTLRPACGSWATTVGSSLSDGPTATASLTNCLGGRPFLAERPCIFTFSRTATADFDSEPDHWYVKAGLREHWHPMGHTVLYAEYAERHNMIDSVQSTTDDGGNFQFLGTVGSSVFGLAKPSTASATMLTASRR